MASEMSIGKIVTITLMIILLVVLILGIRPIQNAYRTFFSIGEEEPQELTLLKQTCTEKQELGACADAAIAVIAAGEESIIAESFLRREKCDQIPKKCDQAKFEINNAKVLEIYQKIKGTNPDEYYTFLNPRKEELMSSLRSLVNYQKDNKVDDRLLLEKIEGCNMLFSIANKNSYLSQHPEDTASSYRACAQLSRSSISVGCFGDKIKSECISCLAYKAKDSDPCSGYNNKVSCDADSCSIKAECRWEGGFSGKCISKQTFLVQG